MGAGASRTQILQSQFWSGTGVTRTLLMKQVATSGQMASPQQKAQGIPMYMNMIPNKNKVHWFMDIDGIPVIIGKD